MNYEKYRQLVNKLGLTPDNIRDLVEAYADGLEDAEPWASNAIEAARETAVGMDETLR